MDLKCLVWHLLSPACDREQYLMVYSVLTQHSDNLFVVVSRVSSLAILSVGGLPDLALARLHDHLHHGDVEEDQDDDGYEEEEYEGKLVYWIPLQLCYLLGKEFSIKGSKCQGPLPFFFYTI